MPAAAQTEVRMAGYRIDAVIGRQLIEIQHGSLAAIRDKVRRLLAKHDVLVVKPIVARKTLVKQGLLGISRRQSPKRGTLLDLFEELVYFVRVFPHKRLSLEIVLVEVEEWRAPGHGRRRRWRKNDHVVSDQKLLAVLDTRRFATAADLLTMLPPGLPIPFHTGDLASLLEVRRAIAQRIAYCLRHCGAVRQVGKRGNTWLYEPALPPQKRPGRRKPKAA